MKTAFRWLKPILCFAMLLGVSMVAVVWFSGCATVSPLHKAAKNGNIAEVERLIKNGANVNAMDGGFTPLHEAARIGKTDMVGLLIAKGADVNARIIRNYTGETALHIAAESGNKAVVGLLIANGADVNATNRGGYTPLDYAVARSKTDVANYLKDVMAGKVKVAVPAQPEDPNEVAAFAAEANRYHALEVKPTLPEEARKYNVQAVASVKDKQFTEAAEHYSSALKVAPWWPDGHFNRALILGELNRFAEAVREMKRYLTLVPDAPNARAAQDKIYEWERLEAK